MPNFLGRLFGISYKTERLIMNILGLVNSTLDWSPIKWRNKLEQIWNLSLSQGTLIFDTIGEDTIKTALSWIVITRIIIAHVYTISYLTNIYPILTSTRPNLLLPWLILSFFKNVVLEVIVIAIGLLLWYDKRFSLTIFLEFVLVKVIPLIIFSYVWYSNSCLFMELRHMEKQRTLRRTMRSDSNLIAARICFKIGDSKYRTRSLMTLISCDSYDTYDTHDTISRIIDDTTLTPAQKTMRILGLTEQDIVDARSRKKEREICRRLTEEEDDIPVNTILSGYFFISNYDLTNKLRNEKTVEDEKNEEMMDEKTVDKYKKDEVKADKELEDDQTRIYEHDTINKNECEEDRAMINEFYKDDIRLYVSSKNEILSEKISKNRIIIDEKCDDNMKVISDTHSANSPFITLTRNNGIFNTQEIKDNFSEKTNQSMHQYSNSQDTKNNSSEKTNMSVDQQPQEIKNNSSKVTNNQRSSTKKRGGANSSEINNTKQMKLCPSYHNEFSYCCSSRKQDLFKSSSNTRQMVEKCCSPVKIQDLFKCNCIVDEYLTKEKLEEYCLSGIETMMTSTPNKSIDREKMIKNIEDLNNSKNANYHSCLNDSIDFNRNQKIDFTANNAFPLIEKLLQNNPNMLMNIKNEAQKLENVYMLNKSMQEVFYTAQNTVSNSMQNLSDIVKDLTVTNNVVTNIENLKTVEPEEKKTKLKTEKEILKTMVSLSVMDNEMNVNSIQKNNLSNSKLNVVKNTLSINMPNKMNVPEYSFGDAKIQKFFQGSMKVFDGCYEKDFANNSELQCLLQQLDKKWSMYPDQSDQDVLISSLIPLNQKDHSIQIQDSKIASVSNFDRIKRYESRTKSSTSEHHASQIVQVNEPFFDNNSYDSQKSSSISIMKDVFTQTGNKPVKSSSNLSLTNGKKLRKKFFFSRKRKESRNISNISMHDDRIESRSSIYLKDHVKSLTHQKSNLNQKKQSSLMKCQSDENICMCKMTDSMHSLSESKKEEIKKCTKCKVETFGTIPLSQVVRPSMFDAMIYRKKPPMYPKKTKNELSIQSNASNTNSKKISPFKKLLETSKKSTEKQSSHTKKFNWKNKIESLVDREAREMRALKAYNEVTLVKYKKELEAKKKLYSGKCINPDANPESSKDRSSSSKKSNLSERSKKNIHKNIESFYERFHDDYVDKENFVDATTETEPLFNIPIPIKTPSVKIHNVSNEKYSCSKLSKVNKVTDKLLDNFDRLHGGQAKQEHTKKNKQTGEIDIRKQYTKYSKPKKLPEDDYTSVLSMKKLEGTQKGRELERTPAKENVRDYLESTEVSSNDTDQLLSLESRTDNANIAGPSIKGDHNKQTSLLESVDFGAQTGNLLTTIKSTIFQKVTSSWSSNSIDQNTKEPQLHDYQVQFPSQMFKVESVQELDYKDEEEATSEIVNYENIIELISERKDQTEMKPILEMENKVDKENKLISKMEPHQEEMKSTLEIEKNVDLKEEIEKIVDLKKEIEENVDLKEEIEKIVDLKKEIEENVDLKKEIEKNVDLKEEIEKNIDHKEEIERNVDHKEKIEKNIDLKEEIEPIRSQIEVDKQEIDNSKVSKNKEEKEIKENISKDILQISCTECIDFEEEVQNGEEIEEIRRSSLEVMSSEPQIRQTSSNFRNFRRNINMSYVGNGVILSNSNSPRGNPRPWDIVDEDTIRMLHNAFSYRSVDTSFDFFREILMIDGETIRMLHNVFSYQSFNASLDFPREILTIDDILNRSLEYPIDEFIFQSDREFMGLAMEQLPPMSYEHHHAIFTTIRQFQNLDEEDQEDGICDLYITTIDHEDLPIEMEATDEFDDDDEVEHTEFRINELLMMIRILRNLNDRGYNLEDIFRLFEIFREPSNDEEDMIEEIEEENEEEKNEEMEEQIQEENKILQFIKEDIFTNIKFPIVVKWTDLIPDLPSIENNEIGELDIMLKETELSKINLFSLKEDSYDKLTCFRTNLLPIEHCITYGILEKIHEENEIIDDEETKKMVEKSEEIIAIEDIVDLKEIKEMWKHKHVEVEEDVAYQMMEENINDTSFKEIYVDKNIQLTDDEENEKNDLRTTDEEMYECEENNIDIDINSDFKIREEVKEEFKKELKEEVKEEEMKEEIKEEVIKEEEQLSLYTIFTFGLVVLYFYIQYYYNEIFTFKQVPASSSSLKPFEIHAIPTSTTTFLKNSRLIKKIKKEKENEEEEKLDEEKKEIDRDSLKSIIDLETSEISSFTDSEFNFDPSVHKPVSWTNLRMIHEHSSKEMGNEVKTIEIHSIFMSDNNLINNSSNIQLQDEIDICSDEKLESLSPHYSLVRNSSQMNIIEFYEKENKLQFIEPDFKMLELRLAQEEIKTLRYKDDDSSSTKSLQHENETKLFEDTLYSSYAKVKIESEKEQFQTNNAVNRKDSPRKSELSVFYEIPVEHEESEEQHYVSEQIIFSKQNEQVEEVRLAVEQTWQPSNSTQFVETTDSFDSTYTKISEVSRNTASIDLNKSSMEDFTIGSNESHESNQSNEDR